MDEAPENRRWGWNGRYSYYLYYFFFMLACNRQVPSHRNTENVYLLHMTILPETHPEYQTEESNPTYQVINFNRVIDRLQQYPEVEFVGVSFPRSYPGLTVSIVNVLRI